MINKISNRIGTFLLNTLDRRPWLLLGSILLFCGIIGIVCEAAPLVLTGCILGIGGCTLP